MADYSIYYKGNLDPQSQWQLDWDLFISAYNSSERVQTVYDNVRADSKHWLMLPDYKYADHEHPSGQCHAIPCSDEAEFIKQCFASAGIDDVSGNRVCIDITGFVKPYMMFLLRWLLELGLEKFDVLFAEPAYYARKEETRFSDAVVKEVRQVVGFEGLHTADTSNDLLIIGAGYDDELIAQVADYKKNSRKLMLFGLPSLRAEMYQENVLRAYRASEIVGVDVGNRPGNFFAPAYDPFITAGVLSEIAKEHRFSNMYICPLATKAQALGFTIFYLTECYGLPVSMLYPICATHDRQTSLGVSRIWHYTVEIPWSSQP